MDAWQTIASILGTFLGALLGIPAGLAVNHAWRHREDRDRKAQLLEALRQAVDQNLYLMNQIEQWLSNKGMPFFNVDLTILDATASLKYELIDIPLCRELDQLRFELSHLARKLDTAITLRFNPQAHISIDSPAKSMLGVLGPPLDKAIMDHIAPIRTKLLELQKYPLLPG